jgi:phosphate transport system substrate-binding protein
MLMGENLILHMTAFILYAAVFLFLAYRSGLRLRRGYIPLVIVIICIGTSAYLYMNRPAIRYAGHGFKYMHGFSSTDFSDYMVYSENSRLVTLDHQPELVIENEEDMPVLDGAEACYPLYAAFAKACYKDIDVIESEWLKSRTNQYLNGKIVTFTNTLRGFDRLIYWRDGSDKYSDAADMFFGARPSAEQMEEAKYLGVELDITPIGREAFVFFVEADNPVDNLTSEQLRAIYHGDITNWKEVGGKNQAIRAFQRPKNSGSQTMMEYFMGDTTMKEPDTYEIVDAMTGVIEEVAQYANEAGAIGYSFRYFLEGLNQEKNVKILSVDGVYPTMENIESGAYPQTGNVCLITRKDETNPYVQKMKEFILSEDGQYIIRQTGYAGLEQKNE